MTIAAELTQPVRIPAAQMPRAVGEALEQRTARLGDFRAAVRRRQEAELTLDGARRRDVEAAARARDAGVDDPEREHETAARAQLEQANRDQEIEEHRLAQAHQRLGHALEQHTAGWIGSVDRARHKIDIDAMKRLTALRTVLEQRQALAGAAAWLAALERGEDLSRALRKGPPAATSTLSDSRNAHRRLTVQELLDAVEDYLEASALDDERAVAPQS